MVVMAMASTIGTETIGVGMAVLDGTIGTEIIGVGTTGVGTAVLDGITGMATIGAGTIGDIQIIITTETMLITPAEEALLMQTITL
jgi:hypothetical protein